MSTDTTTRRLPIFIDQPVRRWMTEDDDTPIAQVVAHLTGKLTSLCDEHLHRTPKVVYTGQVTTLDEDHAGWDTTQLVLVFSDITAGELNDAETTLNGLLTGDDRIRLWGDDTSPRPEPAVYIPTREQLKDAVDAVNRNRDAMRTAGGIDGVVEAGADTAREQAAKYAKETGRHTPGQADTTAGTPHTGGDTSRKYQDMSDEELYDLI